MKSGSVDVDRFRVEGRQSVHHRKMSKHSSVLNGAEEALNYAVEDESVVRQVNLAAAYHDHISCTKAADLFKLDGVRESRGTLPCEIDHIYANCSEIKSKSHTSKNAPPSINTKELTLENINIILSDYHLMSKLEAELKKRKKQISDQEFESEKLKSRLQRRARRMCIMGQNYCKLDNDHMPSEERNDLPTPVPVISSERPPVCAPVLATRYFGRRSKTIPSRALKRRYLGPPKTLSTKQPIPKNEPPVASKVAEVQQMVERRSSARTCLEKNDQNLQDLKKVTKKPGRMPKNMIKKVDFLTTDKAYFLPDCRIPKQSLTSSEIYVPLFKKRRLSSFYQMEGTENINDSVFIRRHLKCEQDERRRKRWDIQRLREQKAAEKLKLKRLRECENPEQRKSQSFYPDLRHIECIEVTDQLPVCAFGCLIPIFEPSEFSLPWKCSKKSGLEQKAKRGRPAKIT